MAAAMTPEFDLYLCGPMTGYLDYNHPEFARIAARLRDEAGPKVWSPHENGLPASATWHEHMRADIAALMRCKALATHGSWQSSRGAQIEVKLAKSLDMEVYPYQVWIPHPALRGNQKK